MDSLQLIDLSKEDDCLLPLSLRDVCEMDSLQLIDLSKEDDCLLPLSLRDVCEMDSLQLIDLSKEDDCLLPLSLRDSVEDVKLSCAVGFDNASMIKRGKMRPVEERSLSELRKSLDWNSAFFTSQGLLNPEELSMINKAFQKTSCSCQPSFSSRKDLKPDIHKRSTVPINRHGLAPNQVVMEHRTRKAGARSTLSSRSQGDFSSRLTSFTTLKTKMSKVHRSNESPSGASSKCISRNIKPTIVDRSSVLSPLSSTCSSSTSPSRSFHNARSPSDFHNATSKVHCSNESHSGASSKRISRNIKSRNIKPTIIDRSSSVLSPLSSTCSSSTSPSRSFHNATSPSDFQTPRCDAARPPIRKIKCLGLRMPYPNTGPFDEAQAVSKGSMHKFAPQLHESAGGLPKTKLVSHSCSLAGSTSAMEVSIPIAFVLPGLLTNEEMTVINKGFAEANSNQPSYGTQNDGWPHQVSGQNQTLSDSDGFHLETLESDLPKYVNPDIYIKNKAKKGLKDDIASDYSKATIDKEKRQDGCKSQEESRRSTFLRKSLDWDSAFIHNAGLLNFEELSLINRGFKKSDPIQSISRARKHIQTRIGSHRDQTCSKIGDLLLGDLEADLFQDVKPDIHKLTKKSNACKATSFSSSTTENNPKVHHSVESQSNDSSKRTSSISSGTSPASRVHVALSESDFQSPPHPPCHNFGERKFTKQCSTRFSIGNITPSGLRMPSPRIVMRFENKKEPTSNQKQKSSIRRGKNPESKERKHLISEVDKNRHQIDPRIDSELAKKPQILAVRQIPNLQNPTSMAKDDKQDDTSNNTSVRELGNVSLQCPKLTEANYTTWALMMETILKAYGIWETIVAKKGVETNEKKENTSKAIIFQTLPQDVLMQVAQYSTAKEVWDSIKVKHLGADLVQKARLQTLRSELETLKIKPNEKVSDFGGKLSSIMAKFKGLGETLEDKVLVRKLLNSVPKKFLPIVATIEQYQDLDEMSFEEAVGRLTAYEERIKSQDTLEANDQDKLLMASSNNKSHFHVAISESDFQSPPHPPCHNFGERKFKKQCSTRFSIGSITPSGLRMPSPRIGFFDEEQPLQLNNKESMQIFNEFQYLERRLSFLNKVYGMVPSSLVQVC
ncbi:hypothetical protein Tco_0031074 [Tanacetum coccineum]